MDLLGKLFAVFAALILPVGAGIWLSLKRKGYLRPVLLGALTFFVFQVVTRIPLLGLLGKTTGFVIFASAEPVLYALFLGATAALFEEGGRYLVMRLLMKSKNRLNDGVAFGVGHGGIEAVLLVGINAVALLFMQTQAVTAEELLAGGFERICTMVVHIALSVMVLKSVALKKPLWLLIAFALHAAIDIAAVMMSQAGMSILAIEAAVFVIALALLAYILIEYKKYNGGEIK